MCTENNNANYYISIRRECLKTLLSRCFFSVILFFFSTFSLLAQNDFYSTVAEIRISFKEESWDEVLDSLFENFGEEGRLEGDVTVNGKLFKGAGVRFKGYSSWDLSQEKNPFNIDLDYHIDNANYQGHTKLKLSNVIHDPSFVREVLSYEIAAKYMPVSKAYFANVYVNDVLIGLYSNVEAVDENMLEHYFSQPKNVLIKGNPVALQYPFAQNSNLAYTHGTDSSGYIPFYKLQTQWGWNQLLRLINTLNNDTANLPTVLNIDRSLWMHAFNYALVNLDSYIGYSQNYYLFLDENKRFNPILWDLNMSFGSFRNSDATSLNLTVDKAKKLNPLQILTSSTFSPRPLIKQLLLNTTYRKMFMAHLRTIIDENISTGWYYSRAQELMAAIDTFVQNDTNKFYTYNDFIHNLDSEVVSGTYRYPGLRDLMEARLTYLQTYPGFSGAPIISEVTDSPELPALGEYVCVTARITAGQSVRLYWRNSTHDDFTSIVMSDDGQHNDGLANDSVFGACLTVSGKTLQYYIWAENDSAGIFAPQRAQYEFYEVKLKLSEGNLALNEICNRQVSLQTTGRPEGWIELFNNSTETVYLKNLQLANGSNYFIFPDTSIKSHGFLMVATELTTTDNMLCAGFSPETSSMIYLKYADGKLIDSLFYNNPVGNESAGRYPNGSGPNKLLIPSFAGYNRPSFISVSGMVMFPNPADTYVMVESNDLVQPALIEIVNSSGQIVSSVYVNESQISNPFLSSNMDISFLPAGVYLMKVSAVNKTVQQKFMIQ